MANNPIPYIGTKTYGKLTQTAGTIIQQLVQPMRNAFTRIIQFNFLSGATAHTVTVRKAMGRTTLSAAAAAGQAVVVLATQPLMSNGTATRVVAANDFLVFETFDSVSGQLQYDLKKVSSVVGLSITLTANVRTGGYQAGNYVWLMSLDTDTVPADGFANPKFLPGTSAVTAYPLNDDAGGWVQSGGRFEPLIIECNNITAASTYNYTNAGYTRI